MSLPARLFFSRRFNLTRFMLLTDCQLFVQLSGRGTPDRLPSGDKTLTIYQGIYFVSFFINAVGDISRRRGLFTVAWLNAILIRVCAIHAPWVDPACGRGGRVL